MRDITHESKIRETSTCHQCGGSFNITQDWEGLFFNGKGWLSFCSIDCAQRYIYLQTRPPEVSEEEFHFWESLSKTGRIRHPKSIKKDSEKTGGEKDENKELAHWLKV